MAWFFHLYCCCYLCYNWPCGDDMSVSPERMMEYFDELEGAGYKLKFEFHYIHLEVTVSW